MDIFLSLRIYHGIHGFIPIEIAQQFETPGDARHRSRLSHFSNPSISYSGVVL